MKLIRRVKNGFINSIKGNIIFLTMVLGVVGNDLLLRAMTTGFTLYWKPIVTTLSVILLISSLVFILPRRKRNGVYIFLSLILGLLNGANYLYYRFYNSFLSLALVNQLEQLNDMGTNVSRSIFDVRALLFLVPTLILIVTIRRLKKANYFDRFQEENRLGEIGNALALGSALLVMVFTTLSSTDLSRLVKQWNRPYIVEQLGIYTYTVSDIVKNTFKPKVITLPEEEVQYVLSDLVEENLNSITENEYKDIFKGKDLFVIHYESAQTFAMDYETPDGPVTPFLNKLASEGLFFSNFYPQHSVGTSSDSEFTFNTSLLPINDGTVFITHTDREYVTLPKLLKEEGYYALSMHGNNGDFWNRNIMHRSLGYDRFFSEKDYEVDEVIGLGLSDMSFFRQSIEKIKAIKEEQQSPIMATLITLTNHYPFDDVDKFEEFNVGHLEGTGIGNYLKSYRYADMALESFIKGLDEEGLLDNAVVVIYGDHHAKITKSDYEKLYNYNEETGDYYTEEDPEYVEIDRVFRKKLNRTPFIIWSKDYQFAKEIDTPMGMVDALPTIANMFGVFNPYQLGKDILSVDSNTVIFPDGDWINDQVYYLADNSQLYSLETGEKLEDEELLAMTEAVEDKILLSNNIIQNNLIQYYKGLLAKNNKNKQIEINSPIEDNISSIIRRALS